MKFLNLKDFERGWLLGNFEPSLLTCENVEVGIIHHKKGELGDGHYHKKHTEYNFISKGKVVVHNEILRTDSAFVFESFDRAFIEYLEDTDLVVIKIPALKDDKFY